MAGRKPGIAEVTWTRLVRLHACAVASVMLASLATGYAIAEETQYDLVIRSGRILDGSGNPWFHGDVAICGDRIAAIGRIPPQSGKREIHVPDRFVAPGFIDIHSHSDLLLLEDGSASSKIRQGVTTEVLGEGNSTAPYPGEPESSSNTGPRFRTMPDYFAALETRGTAVNVATYVGLDNIWNSAMSGSFSRPTADQMNAMKRTLEQAMQDGAYGLSSMLAMPPGSLANTDDIVELCRVVARFGGIYSTHNRHEGEGVLDAVKEAITIGEKAGVPVDIIHLKIADQKLWGRMPDVISLIENARQQGINVQAHVYPYTRGSNNLSSIIPPWVHEGGTAKMLERLRDPSLRPRIKQEIRDGLPGWYNHYTAVGGDWSRMLISAAGPYQGLTMDRVLSLRQKDPAKSNDDPLDHLFDILLDNAGSVPTVYEHHSEADMNLALRQPWCSIGSDGSALAIAGPLRRGNPHPRSFGTFPRALGVYARDRGLLSWEDAVRKMTSLNASKIGLTDRGNLRVGAYADITIFDPNRIVDRATYESPFAYAEGIDYVIVNGTVVFDDGQPTPHRPGRPLRKGK